MKSTANPGESEKFSFARPFALWIGGIWSGKNPLQLIEIAKQLPHLDFVVVGPSRDRELLEEFNKEKPPNVYYLGAVIGAKKIDLIRKCATGISTSLRETFGWVPFEFLSEGKPVICHPLPAFKQLYRNLPIYANTTADFVRQIRVLQRSNFKTHFDRGDLLAFQERYSVEKAADAMVRRCSGRSMSVFAIDTDLSSDYVSGLFLVDWQLWKSICDKGIEFGIISNGKRYATEFRLTERTTLIPAALLLVKEKIEYLDGSNEIGAIMVRKLLRFLAYTLEPLSYVFSFVRYASSSEVILSEGHAQAAAAIAAKLLLRKRAMCMFHDNRLFMEPWDASRPFMVRVFSAILSRFVIRFADRVVVVSETLREQIVRFKLDPGRVGLLWP